ncbi:ferrous iron transporter B [Haloferula rosea]|uniref:Ferrous iron transporter B n=1 Tax=Haloferula rosea TaxID=490093 RepID=A0A934R8H5_9BACT|nr:ferrous iron transporter B [Haloferula rosea]MBK1825908.1 ferrous iron transporter B [Haloferula rosea]
MEEDTETVVLAGNPNVGKTTLFNALTGSSAKVGNYAGATVELKEGFTRTPHGRKLKIIDLPGCLSLEGAAPDQQLARRALLGEVKDLGKPDLALCVLDASNLERHLVLALEIIETGLPVVLVLNMIDVAEASGLRLDPQKLSEELKVPVVAIQADKQKGLLELKQAIRHPLPPAAEAPWADGESPTEARQQMALSLCALAARRPDAHQSTRSDKLDAVLLHPVWGWVCFISVMFAVFWSIFSFAEVPMGWVESLQGWLGGLVENSMADGDLRSLIVDGIIGGVGSVVIFLPQILMLFFFIGLLESSGYMARAAFLMDGLMSKVGLSGKAFLPLLSSYACAIPGIMATRSIDSAKERLVTIFVAPWMSCTARLPVYFLLIPMLLDGSEGGWVQASILLGIYVFGTATAFLVARILRGRLGPDDVEQHFMLELPPYRAPQWPYVFRHLFGRGWAFLRKAGTVILGIVILLWAAQTYPKTDSEDPAEQLAHSAMGRISAVIEPVVKPLGFDGRTGTAVLTSFAAREVFNASMFQLFHVEEDPDDEEGSRAALRQQLASETWEDGTRMFRPLSVISLLLFYIYALQCLPTSAVVAREAGSWKWAVGQFAFMTVFAAGASLVVYQVGSLLGF